MRQSSRKRLVNNKLNDFIGQQNEMYPTRGRGLAKNFIAALNEGCR